MTKPKPPKLPDGYVAIPVLTHEQLIAKVAKERAAAGAILAHIKWQSGMSFGIDTETNETVQRHYRYREDGTEEVTREIRKPLGDES